MSAVEELEAIKAGQARLAAEVEKANDNFDRAIVIANTTRDALTEALAAGGSIGGGGTPVEPAAELAQIKALAKEILESQDAAIASLKAQQVEGDAAAAAIAP